MSTFGNAGDLDWGEPVEKVDESTTPETVSEQAPVPAPTVPRIPAAAPPVPAQPAPVAPAAPVPPLPTAPVARQPVSMQTRPVATPPAPVAPVVAQSTAPAPQPVAPAQPAPVAPEPVAAEPEFIPPAPVAPEPTPQHHEPVYAAPEQPAPVQEYRQPEPEYSSPAQPVFQQPGAPQETQEQAYWEQQPQQFVQPAPAPQAVPQPVAEPRVNLDTEDEGRGRGKRSKAKKVRGAKGTKSEKVSLVDSAKGGRGKLIAFRVLAWSVLGLLLLGGLKNVVTPNEKLSISQIAGKVEAHSGTKGFPLSQGAAFAARFTSVYLTYDPDTTDARIEALKSYSVEAGSANYAVEPVKKQSVLVGPFLADSEVTDKHNAIVTIAAYTSDKKWVYLAVPLFSADLSTFVVSGAPGFVSSPALAVAPEATIQQSIDSELSDQLTTDLFNGFFDAWATSDSVALARYTTEKPTANTLTGLRGAVAFTSVEEVRIPQSKKDTRTGAVTVLWQTPTGSYPQQYRVTIHLGADDRWSIQDIRGGVVSPAGTSTDVKPDPDAVPTDGVQPEAEPN